MAELSRLADLMIRLTPPRTEDDFATLAQANEDFHRTIYVASGSPRLKVVMAAIVDVGVVARTYRSYRARDLARSARHHREIADAIAARAPDWADHVMTAHVLAAMAALEATFDQGSKGSASPRRGAA